MRRNFFKGTKGKALAGLLEVNFWWIFQVLLPLVDQYFTNHRLYFLSSPLKPLSSSGYASHKEKEMVARWVYNRKRRSRCWCDLYNTSTSWGLTGESFGEMNCSLMSGSSEVWVIILVLKVILFVLTYVLFWQPREVYCLGGVSRAWGKCTYSGELLSWNNI